MSGYVGDLSAKQERALLQFKESVSAIPQLQDDRYLLRWLRARNFNVHKSEKMIRQHMSYSKEYKLTEIMDWTPPEVLQRFYPAGWFGEDREGSPVLYIPFGNVDLRGPASTQFITWLGLLARGSRYASRQLDNFAAVPDEFATAMIHCSLDRLKMHNTLNLPTPRTGRQEDENLIIKFMWPYGLLHSAKPYDVIRQMLQQGVMSVAKMQQQSEKHGRVIEDVTVIFDLEKLSIQRHLWKPGIEVTCRGFNLFEANFPEILKAVYILKASKIFPVAWGIVKPFVEEKTRKKVNVLGANWQEELRKHIAPDQLPEYYGGKCRDANDDPKCAEHICYGGDIPHSYYSSQCDRASDSLNATDISISRGSRHTVDVEVTKPLSVIRWEFQTDSHDIGFGLFFKGQVDSSISMSVDEMDEMVSIKRWDCHRVPEDGHFVAELVGTYVICFDNSHSWLRTKNVRFVVDVLDPVKMDEEDEVLS